jgi:hypothetical protein
VILIAPLRNDFAFHATRSSAIDGTSSPRLLTNSLPTAHIFESGTLVEQLRALTIKAKYLKGKSELAGDHRTALLAVRELRRIVELVAKLRGELDERAEIDVVNFQLDAETAKKIGNTFLARHKVRETLP